jgi:hypothetical protein
MVSQGAGGGVVVSRRVRGQASPRLVPSMAVREAGQMGPRPSIRTLQRVGRGTIGTEEAEVVWWEIR